MRTGMFLPVSLNASEILCEFIGMKQRRGMAYSCGPVLHPLVFWD